MPHVVSVTVGEPDIVVGDNDSYRPCPPCRSPSLTAGCPALCWRSHRKFRSTASRPRRAGRVWLLPRHQVCRLLVHRDNLELFEGVIPKPAHGPGKDGVRLRRAIGIPLRMIEDVGRHGVRIDLSIGVIGRRNVFEERSPFVGRDGVFLYPHGDEGGRVSIGIRMSLM